LKYNNTDRFALDGQRIMPLDSGYIHNGQDGTVYRTENENFLRIYSKGNYNGKESPDYFEVLTTDGGRMEYTEQVVDPQSGVPVS